MSNRRRDASYDRHDDPPRGGGYDGSRSARDGGMRSDQPEERRRPDEYRRPDDRYEGKPRQSAFSGAARGGRGGQNSPPRRTMDDDRRGGGGAPPGRGAYDGGGGARGGGGGGGYDDRPPRAHDGGFAPRRDDHDDRRAVVSPRPANTGNDARMRGGDMEKGGDRPFGGDQRREPRDQRDERGGNDFARGGPREERNGGDRDGGQRGGGGGRGPYERDGRDREEGGGGRYQGGGGPGHTQYREDGGAARGRGGGGYGGDIDRDNGGGGGGQRGRGAFNGGGERDRDEQRGGGGQRYGGDRDNGRDERGGGKFGEDRGGGGKFGEDRGYNNDRDDNRGSREGFGGGGRGGRDGGNFGGRGGGRSGMDRGEQREDYGGRREDGGFGSGRGGNGFNDDRNGSFGGGGGGRGGGSGGFRGGRGGGSFGGDRDRDNNGFGGDRGGGGGFGRDNNRDGEGFGNNRGGDGFGGSGFTRSSGFTDRGPARDYNEMNRFGERRYAGPGYKTKYRAVEELYESDARNSQDQVLDSDEPVNLTGPDADSIHAIEKWEDSGLDQDLIDICLLKCKYKTVRPIQAIGIPAILAGRDILAQSETGSGKSASFMLPIVHEMLTSKRDVGSQKVEAIMVAPTKELVSQLYEQAIRFTKGIDEIKVVVSIGQSAYGPVLGQLMEGCHILIATIGRLKDHMKNGHIVTDSLRYFVLDEADRMLEDKGGSREMEEVFRHHRWPKPDDLQSLLFSATMPQSVKNYARQILKKNFLTITPNNERGANKKIKQLFFQCDDLYAKNTMLMELLNAENEECEKEDRPFRKTLIFVNKKDQTNALAIYLTRNLSYVQAQSINGDKAQDLRDEAIAAFRSGEVKILIGTDVCERGLDIEGLQHVINFDLPTEGERYTHRIGRTGRVRNGTATSFISKEDSRVLGTIIEIAKAGKQEVPEWMEELNGGGAVAFGNGGGSFGNGGGGFGKGGGGDGFGNSEGGFGGGGGGGFGASNGFGGDNGFGSGAADDGGFGSVTAGTFDSNEWGTAASATDNGETKEVESNAFSMNSVSETLPPLDTTSITPSEFKAQNNAVEDDDW